MRIAGFVRELLVTVESKRLQRSLSALASRAKDPSKVLAWTGRFMALDVRGVFSEFQTKGRGTWAPLRLRRGEPLRDTRTLERAIGWRVTGGNVAIGTNLRYGRTHQIGMTIRAKTRKGLRFIGPNAGASRIAQRRGASIRRTGKLPASGKLPAGLRWYRLEKVTIPRRRFLRWRPEQLRICIGRAREYLLTGKIPAAAASGGNPSGTGKLRRRTY